MNTDTKMRFKYKVKFLGGAVAYMRAYDPKDLINNVAKRLFPDMEVIHVEWVR